VIWDGRNSRGELLPDGAYALIVETFSSPWDDTPPVKDGFVMNVELDSTRIITPLTLSSGKSGLLYAPVPALLPPGSFQIEGRLLAGSVPETGAEVGSDYGRAWASLPFSAGFRFSPVERLEVSAALNVLPRFDGEAGAGVAGGVKWLYLNPERGLPLGLGAAAGAVVSWTGTTGLTPFGMASGVEFLFPFKVDIGNIFSFSFAPAMTWTGDEGFPWEPAPRFLISGGLLARLAYISAGLSVRIEHNFSDGRSWPPRVITGAEVKIFPPPSSFVFSLMSGIWTRDSRVGGFVGLGIGMIY
jgi:hypothetical protein